MQNQKNKSKIVLATAKAFSGETPREHYFQVSPDGVKVWDSVATIYTRVHSLSPEDECRITAIAAAR